MDLKTATFIRIDCGDQVSIGNTVYPLVRNAPETKRPCKVLGVFTDGVLVRNDMQGLLLFSFKTFTRAFDPDTRND